MGFVKMPGLPGKVYVPDKKRCMAKKHPCKDCFSCEFCSDDRCRICRKEKSDMTGGEVQCPGKGIMGNKMEKGCPNMKNLCSKG